MSSNERIPLAEAEKLAAEFQDLIPETCYSRWEVAGSVRRRCPMVGDVEIVVIPRYGTIEVREGLFPTEKQNANLLWNLLDAHVQDGHMKRWLRQVQCRKCEGKGFLCNDTAHTCPTCDGRQTLPRECWGDKFRAVEFRGRCFDVFTATPNTWGSQLAVRTGPAEYSHKLVTCLLRRGLRQEDGWVRNKRTGDLLPCPEESRYFELCGVPMIPPERRM